MFGSLQHGDRIFLFGFGAEETEGLPFAHTGLLLFRAFVSWLHGWGFYFVVVWVVCRHVSLFYGAPAQQEHDILSVSTSNSSIFPS